VFKNNKKTAFGLIAVLAFAIILFSALASAPRADSKADAAKTAATGQVDKEIDKAQVESIIKDYLMAHPDVIVDALNAYQNNQQQAEADNFTKALAEHHDDVFSSSAPTAGNPNGDVTVVEFFDYNCGYCKHAISDVQQLVKNDKNVKVIFHDLPILAPSSELAARWALAAGKQGKYWEYHQALMNFSGGKSEDTLAQLGQQLNLDVDKMRKDASSDEISKQLADNAKLAQELGIHGTPAFLINDFFAPGYMGYDNMVETVKAQRAAKKG
jgi:protein-disulfide isomerase